MLRRERRKINGRIILSSNALAEIVGALQNREMMALLKMELLMVKVFQWGHKVTHILYLGVIRKEKPTRWAPLLPCVCCITFLFSVNSPS